jgi:hypothetical protein
VARTTDVTYSGRFSFFTRVVAHLPQHVRPNSIHTTDSANRHSGAPQAEHEVRHGAQGDTRANGREGGGRHMASEPKAM